MAYQHKAMYMCTRDVYHFGEGYFNNQPIQVCSAFLTPFFKAKVATIDLAFRTISPVDPEYYGTCPAWDLNSQNHILSGGYQGQGTAQFTSSSQQHACMASRMPVHGWALPPALAAHLSD